MDLDQYLEEAVPQINTFGEDKSSLQNWKSATDAVADSDYTKSDSFDCNICLDCVQDPVVTLCGHLYCWPCIYKWIHLHRISSENDEPQRPQCPVCKSEVSQSSLIPLYGHGRPTKPSKGKANHIGVVIPRRPLGPPRMADPPRSTNATTSSQPPQYYHRHNPYHYQHFNSIPGSYISSAMPSTGGSLSNAFDTTNGVFGEMIYARVFGNQLTNMYTYRNSYHLAGNGNPRIRRHLMQADKSLSRICFFLLCTMILCLLLF